MNSKKQPTSPLDTHALLKHMSSHPGIYQMFDASGKVIYVGKAKDLKKRVSSYFRRQLSTKTQSMMMQVVDIQTIITTNENEALLLEANLIKKLKPRYNILLRDDKSYPFLFLQTDHPFPRMDFYRGTKRKKGRFFGPYPSAGSVRENLALIQKLFKIRQCSDHFYAHRSRPCLQYQIKRCTAPCVGYVDESDYQQQVAHAVLFLEGKNSEVIKELSVKMDQAAQQLDYERAAIFRDQITQLRRLQQQQFVTKQSGNLDIVNIQDASGQVALTLLFIRHGRLIGHKTYFPNIPLVMEKGDILAQFIPQYYLHPLRHDDIPERVVVSCHVNDRLWVQEALRQQLGCEITISDRQIAGYQHWQHMASMNGRQALIQHMSEKDAVHSKLVALQRALSLSDELSRIECFDISHTMGQSTVASCVVYGKAGPLNKEYRRFNIEGIVPGDDYAAMKQALTRRYTRLKKGEGVMPDLLLIDGGKGQLAQAVTVLEELQVTSVMILAIAKGPSRKPGREQLFLAGSKKTIQLSHDDMALHLLQFIRDEAHRFAITGHRRKRGKVTMTSLLQQIPGIGAKRRQLLLKYFGGMQALKGANLAEIEQVPGISQSLAKRIYQALHDDV